MHDQEPNTTDATRGLSLRARVAARKLELEEALAKLGPDGRASADIEHALSEVSGLLTGDLDQIPHVVAAELNSWLESNKHVNEWRQPAVASAPPTSPHAPQRLHGYADLVAFLVAKKVPHEADASRFAVQLPTKPPALPSVVYLRWDQKIPYIQVMQQIAGPVVPERVREIEAALCRINDKATLPGYSLSYTNHVIYYRLDVPIYDGSISTESLYRAITAVLENASQLQPALEKVMEGASGASVLAQVTPHN